MSEPNMNITSLRERKCRVAEHEILLSFEYDQGAEAFSEWWREEGERRFRGWLRSSVEHSVLVCGDTKEGA